MLKFFRKYNKVLLAVFGVLLMVVFVGGQALQSLWTPQANALLATSQVGDIELRDQQRAQATTTLLERMGFAWRQPFGGGNEPLTLMDWILLTREARNLKIEPSPAAVKAWLKGQNAGEGRNLLDIVDVAARSFRVKKHRVLQAIAEFRAVQAVVQAMSGATAVSTPAMRIAVRDELEKVKVNVVVLPAAAFADDQAKFGEAELKEQWQQYRDAKPQGGLSFGYYVEPTLTVQYVKIDRNTITEQIGVANLEKRARRYFDANKQRDVAFRRPPEDDKSGDDDADGKAAAKPDAAESEAEKVEEEKKSPYLDWEDAKSVAMDAVRKKEAYEAADRIANWMCRYDAERWLEVQREEDGYKPAPEGAKSLESFNKMVGLAPKSIAYPDAVSVKVTGAFNIADARDVPEIGRAMHRPERGAVQTFGQMAFRSQPIVPAVPTESGADYIDYLAMYQSCPFPLTDDDGNLYVFRVVDTVEGHAAESVDEVRDRVVADLQLLSGYELAESWAENLLNWEDAENLESAYNADTELSDLFGSEQGRGGGYFTSTFVSRPRGGPALSGFGDNVFAGGGLGIVPGETVRQWFTLEDTAERMGVSKLAARATVYVAEWAETQPARVDAFDERKAQVATRVASLRAQEIIADWLDPEHIRARNAFELVGN